MDEEEYAALVAAVEHELAAGVDRLRRWSHSAWRASAGPFRDRAALVRHLASGLADAAQTVEAAPDDARQAPHQLPELPVHALADMLAVTGGDLVAALRAAGPRRPVTFGGESMPVDVLAVTMLAEVLLHRHDLDRTRPGRGAAAMVCDVLGGGGDDALAVARARCRKRSR